MPALDENLQAVETNRLETIVTTLRSRLDVLLLQLKTLAGLASRSAARTRGRPRWGRRPTRPGRCDPPGCPGRPDLGSRPRRSRCRRCPYPQGRGRGRWDASVNVATSGSRWDSA
jgi:hypothetical protein